MPDYFFNEINDIPQGLGFALFDATHLAWLLGLAIFCFIICILFCRLPVVKQKLFAKRMAVFMIVLEVVKIALLIYYGRFSLGYLPVSVCGISMFVCLWHSLTGNDFPAEVTYALSLPGAVVGLLFADWTAYPTNSFFALENFLIHILIISYPLMHVFAGRIKPRLRKLWMPLLFLALLAPSIYFLNRFVGTNFLQLNIPTPNNPFSFFEGIFGSLGYYIGIALVLLIIWFVIYTPFYYININEKK